MDPWTWLSVLGAVGAAVLIVSPGTSRLDAHRLHALGRAGPGSAAAPPAPDPGWLVRHRTWWSLLAGAGAVVLLHGPVAVVGGVAAAVTTWVVVGRAEPPERRRLRIAVARDLPHVVGLLADALASGQDPGVALGLVCDALPGAAADQLRGVPPRLSLGADPLEVWTDLAADPVLGPLGRTLARAHASGAPVATAVTRLAEELARAARGEVEDRARQVGVRAAVPLGLCLLPAFVLIGIVPLVAGLFATLDLG